MTDLATFTTYEALIAQMRARRIALGMSQLSVDARAGLPDGYTAKIEASLTNPSAKNARSIGRESLPLMLGALGLELAAVSSSRGPATRGNNGSEIKEKQRPRIKTLSERGQKGGRIRWTRMSDKQRSAMIRKMNRARADKHRKEKAATKRTRQAEVVT